MEKCMLCGKSYMHLKLHLSKKNACISPKTIADIYSTTHNLLALLEKHKDVIHVAIKNANVANNGIDEIKTIDKLIVSDEVKLQDEIKTLTRLVQPTKTYETFETIHPFNKVTFDMLPEEKTFIDTYEKLKNNGFKQFIKQVYCNPDYPENHVIQVSSMNGIFCKKFNGQRWEIEPFYDICIEIANIYYTKTKKMREYTDFHTWLLDVKAGKKQSMKEFKSYILTKIMPIFYNYTTFQKSCIKTSLLVQPVELIKKQIVKK
jgi:hypothetical protein